MTKLKSLSLRDIINYKVLKQKTLLNVHCLQFKRYHKLQGSQTAPPVHTKMFSLRDIINYKVLKHTSFVPSGFDCLRDIINYKVLKRTNTYSEIIPV